MPNIGVKLYSLYFKLLLKHRLQSRTLNPSLNPFGVTSRRNEEPRAPSNPSFSDDGDGIATKDIHIDPLTSLSIRIFLPNPNPRRNSHCGGDWDRGHGRASVSASGSAASQDLFRRSSNYGVGGSSYKGYLPFVDTCLRQAFTRFPVMIQFHGGGFVFGSNDSVANDAFCRQIARQCEAIVVAVGYRLAPESRYPAAFEDGLKVLNWLGKQANLAECGRSMGGGGEARRLDGQRHVLDAFGAGMVEPWLAAHADLSRCILLGASCGANIADFVARKAVEAGNLLSPVKIVAQVLMYPFFIGSIPTRSELKLANSYFYDKSMCLLAWKLFLPEEEFSLNHTAANPLVPGSGPPLKCMPPTLMVVAEHDWMKDRAIAYSEELRRVNVDAPVLEYKDAVHEFATLDILLKTPQAQACIEDIAIWVKKYISSRGHELSY